MVAIARAGHVVLRAGPWTVFLEAETGVRFPDVAALLPDPAAPATRLRLDPGDARFLRRALDALPGADRRAAPVTLDLAGRVLVRVRGADGARPTELVLVRSCAAGPPVRLAVDRTHLARAVRLGFTRFALAGGGAPVIARDGPRVYAWQPLEPGAATGPADDVLRIGSCPGTGHCLRRTRPADPR